MSQLLALETTVLALMTDWSANRTPTALSSSTRISSTCAFSITLPPLFFTPLRVVLSTVKP